MLVSVTRLRVRSWRYLPGFFIAAIRAALQARRAEGSLAVSLLAEARHAFWTYTLWSDEAAMRAYVMSGAHGAIMPRLLEWCDEAAVGRWITDSAQQPSWHEVWERIRREGRASRVKHPSEAHSRFDFPPPKVGRGELRFK